MAASIVIWNTSRYSTPNHTDSPCSVATITILSKLLAQRLDRNVTAKLHIPRPPCFAHTALSKGRNDFIVCKF